ncbi:leucine-rich PPR motif-containing protein mitochondrial protein [Dioscorea alata]|uniref:Leucine-rich PPR motif-containing protein mitochondrial protein n=1 Tax=Dioscorea alata TaxID=55571 RepID=A0ACB7WR50_DIOAL|nr:leucine-rich PPR motif-containing protein mitochondrial protein [Dioscorea alata]
MSRLGILPDVFTVSIVVNAYCRDGEVQKGLGFVEEMERKGFEVNIVAYHALINGYCSVGEMEVALSLFRLMVGKGILPNAVSYTLLIKGYCKQGKIAKAEEIIKEMKEMPCLAADEVAYGVIINAYCQLGKMDDAIRVRDNMQIDALKPNISICNTIINGYCKAGRVKEAEKILIDMEFGSLKPDSYSYHTLLDGFCKEGLMDKAFETCNVMLERGIEVTVLTYNTLLKGFCLLGAMDDALHLWFLMLKRGVAPNEISSSTLLDGFLKTGDFERALKLWSEILARGFAKNQITFNTAINGFCKIGRMGEAEAILTKMKDLGCCPDCVTYRTLIDGYCKAGDLEKAFRIRDEMEASGFSPSFEMISSLLSIILYVLCIQSTLFTVTATNAANNFVTCLQNERDALLQFKSTIIDPNKNLASWSSGNCCNWRGIRCHNITHHVSRINLRNSSLQGEINPSLLTVQHLIHLDLSFNFFNFKPIPQFIGSIKSLRYLNLSTAGFSGEVPSSLGNLSSLHVLDLSNLWYLSLSSDYVLHVSDSQWLSQLTALQNLEMSGVNFTYASSWLQDLNSLPHIKILGVCYCGLQTIPLVLPHVNFTYLNFLDLSYNSINSTIPAWLFKITSLEYLDLSRNIKFHGLVPPDIRNLTSLYVLVLSYNSIDMSLAILQLGNLRNLQYLYSDNVRKLIYCPFHELGGNFSELATTLQLLKLSRSKLTGSLPHCIGNFTNLQFLDVSANSLSGEIPLSLGQLSGLRELILGGNQFNGTVPESLVGLSELLYFDLSYNSLGGLAYTGISDTMPDWFWSLTPQLYELVLSFNAIRGNVPSALQFTSPKSILPFRDFNFIGVFVDLSSNFFEGPLPLSVANVEYLRLSNNSFSGSLPQGIHKTMLKLKGLYLSMNNLSGTIPLELCQSKYLEELDVSMNLLIGEFPDCRKDDAALKALDFSFSNLSGKIPYSVFSLPLVSFSLNKNKFSGEIPSSLQKCLRLLYLDLGHNKLTGNIPTWLRDKQLRLFTHPPVEYVYR